MQQERIEQILVELGYNLMDRGKYWQTNAVYREGDNKTAIQIWKDTGWVELIQKYGRVYYCKHPTESLYKHLMQCGAGRLDVLLAADKFDEGQLPDAVKYYERDLGLAVQLASERLNGPFIMPPMGYIKDNEFFVGTGTSRITAELMCATPAQEILFVVYIAASAQENLSNFFHIHHEISSTNEYESLFGLGGIDYSIRMEIDEYDQPGFVNSILSHSLYDYSTNNEASAFENIGRNLIYKTKGVSNQEGQIIVEVRCTEKAVEFIPKSNQRYKVEIVIQKDEEWHWSFGRFLALTNDRLLRETRPKIYLLMTALHSSHGQVLIERRRATVESARLWYGSFFYNTWQGLNFIIFCTHFDFLTNVFKSIDIV